MDGTFLSRRLFETIDFLELFSDWIRYFVGLNNSKSIVYLEDRKGIYF